MIRTQFFNPLQRSAKALPQTSFAAGITLPPVNALQRSFQSSSYHRPCTTAGDTCFPLLLELGLVVAQGLKSSLRGLSDLISLCPCVLAVVEPTLTSVNSPATKISSNYASCNSQSRCRRRPIHSSHIRTPPTPTVSAAIEPCLRVRNVKILLRDGQ